ncbi:hypothetical protein [Granulosicoccus antarcticus]|uniref:hypothetical protein n=1 Tax=Granulosicoccus antarcticus TaxID=437505 RepID=UPI0012FD6C17|nr:hypothetical protein [Granulosicoccus antarcticus]
MVTRFIDATGGGDPFVPDAPMGAVTSVSLAPPHVLIGSSQFGLTVKNVLFDYSTEFSPAFVLEHGQSADWVGLAIEEVAIYCPSNAVGKGGFSLSVRDLLIGDPAGLQAQIEVQFGSSPLNPATFVFTQNGSNITSGFDFDNGTLELQAAADEAVELTVNLAVPAPPADSDILDYEAEFDFPGSTPQTGDSATGSVVHGDVIRITPIEVLGTAASPRRLRKPAFTVRMVTSGTAPRVSVQIMGSTLSDVVDLTGPIDQITTLTLEAAAQPPDVAATFEWSSSTLGFQRSGASLPISVPAEARGVHHILLKQTGGAQTSQTRIRLRLREPDDGALLIGCENGIFDATNPVVPLAPTLVLGVYDLAAFHEHGRLDGANAMGFITGTTVNIPPGTIAEVALIEGGTPVEGDTPASVINDDRHVQVLFHFDESDPQHWGPAKPLNEINSVLHESLLVWAANYPGAKFVVIGRCDDVGSDGYNVRLAGRRRDAGIHLLRTAAGSQVAVTGTVEGHQEQNLGGLDAATKALVEPVDAEASARLIKDPDVVDRSTWSKDADGNGLRNNAAPDPSLENIRINYRRVDIYAVGGTPTPDAIVETTGALAPTRRQVLVPAAGRDVLPADNDDANADYRVLLKLGWDRPRFSGWEDIVPNLAEFEYAWTPSSADGVSTTSEVLSVFGKWIYDDLTGFTEFLVGIESEGDPDGLFDIQQSNIVAALTFGPMLASGVDFDTAAVESGVRLAAIAAITGFAGVDFGGGGPLIGTDSKSAFTKLQAKAQTRTIADPLQSYKVQILTDYSNTVHVNTGALGLRTDPDQPMKIKYTDVGIEFDNTDPDAPFIEKIGLAQSSTSMSIEDSGLWKITGPLGRLLRITEFKMGTGSLWFEPTLAVAIDIGVVEISEASFRITFNTDANGNLDGGPEFSLRGLKAAVDIPGTIKGEGRIKIEDNGILKAGVDATLIPLQIRGAVALAVGIPDDPPDFAPSLFLSLYARIQFPGGIPLGTLPLAIHGFIGQVVINGTRDVAETEDVVAREIGWWRKDPEDKYKPKKGQYAFGLGVVVGTLPDASFSFSVTGMVVVAFPDIEVIFGVEVNILSVPDKSAKDKKEGQSASITGLVVINEEAVTVAVSASYTIPGLLSLQVPFSAHFPGSGAGTYVRIGSDNGPGRAGEPVTITFLPGVLDISVWSYLMVEGGGLPAFGPNQDWNFDGFSIGFGAGAGFEWEAGPFELSVSGAIYVGMGTDPLFIKGGLYLRGSLDLVIISASVDAAIVVSYYDPPGPAAPIVALEEARFCAEVDFFFFSVRGCITLDFGSAASFEAPDPEPPVASISLTDRLNVISGEATTGTPQGAPIYDFIEIDGQSQNQGVPPEDNHTVWPDTVLVLNFRHFAQDAIPDGAQFDPGTQPSGEPWFGSNRLRYAYRLLNVRLVRDDDDTPVADPTGAPLLSVWTHSPSRAADDTSGNSGAPPSGAEVTHLQLLNLEPSAWAQSTAGGGEGQPGDPAEIIRRVCDPVPPPRRGCLTGAAARILAPSVARLRRVGSPPGPYPSNFQGLSRSFVAVGDEEAIGSELVSLVSSFGAIFEPGVHRAVPTTGLETGVVSEGYQLPRLLRASESALVPLSLPWRIELNRAVQTGTLTLLVCDSAETDDGTDNEGCYEFKDLAIGKQGESFDLPPFTISAIQRPNAQRRNSLQATDRIDLSNALNPVFGTDNKTDVLISDPGATIKLKQPCHALELHYFKPSIGKLILRIHHADGSTTQVVMDTPAARPAQAMLQSASGIVSVEMLTDGLKQFHLYRVCCKKPGQVPPDNSRDCIDFRKLPKDIVNRSKFEHGGVIFQTLDASQKFSLSDAVDMRPDPDRRGQDGIGDIQLPPSGARVTLAKGCRQLEVSVMLGASAVKVTGFNAAGNAVASVKSTTVQGVGQMLTLSAKEPILSIVIEGGSGEAFLYRICCQLDTPTGPANRCIALGKLKLRDTVSEVRHEGLVFRDPRAEAVLKSVPANDQHPGALAYDKEGLEIALPRSATELSLHLLVAKGSSYQLDAFDAEGRKVGGEGGEAPGNELRLKLTMKLRDKAITLIEIRSKGGGALAEICIKETGVIDRLPIPIRLGVSIADMENTAVASTLPEVRGRTRAEGGDGRAWSPQVISTHPQKDGSLCRVVRYQMPGIPQSIDEIRVLTRSPGQSVTFIGLCAIDERAAQWHARDELIRTQIGETTGGGDGSSPTDTGRPIVLDPDTTYRVEIDWAFQSWISEQEDEQPPATPPAANWQPGPMQLFRFRTASETTTIPTRQDGPNEHLFDPRDLDRYLAESAPANGAIAHFTGDPVVFHFLHNHVFNLVERYGRGMEIEVRRTDPEPQSGGTLLNAAATPLTGLIGLFNIPFELMTMADQRITDAAREAPCIDSERPVGGTSLAGVYPLEPDVFYDANLWAVKSGDSGDRIMISAANFRTSRYVDPEEMIMALGCDTDGNVAPSPAAELILDTSAVLPSVPAAATPIGSEPPSDRLFDEAMNAMGLGTLGLPDGQARLFQLWEQGSSGAITPAGFLIDALEPLNRKAHVLSGSEVVIVDRCRLREGRYGGVELRVARINRNSTRVLLLPVTPIRANVDPASFELILDTSDGTLTGRRQMRTRPLMLDLEGF